MQPRLRRQHHRLLRLSSAAVLPRPSAPAALPFSYICTLADSETFRWNSFIKDLAGCVTGSRTSAAPPLLLYKQFLLAGGRPDGHTHFYLIRAAATAAAFCSTSPSDPQQLHAHVLKNGFGFNEFVATGLVRFYAVVKLLGSAFKLFEEIPQPGLVSRTAMIRSFATSSCPKMALGLFLEMRSVGLVPDSVAVSIILSACGQMGNYAMAMAIHCLAQKAGVELDAFVRTELIGAYGGFGALDLARQVFDEMAIGNLVVCNAMIHQYVMFNLVDIAFRLFMNMDFRDVISWNTMMFAFSRAGRHMEAMQLFYEMELSGLKPNRLTLCTVLAACANSGALETGMWIQAYIDKWQFNVDGSLDASLIDMYAKCGSIVKAIQVFSKIPRRYDLYSWTSAICGLAMHGRASHAIRLFYRMQELGISPDEITFVGILNACAHAGLLREGFYIFQLMQADYCITPKIEHYGCMIDLLGRTGCLEEAYGLAIMMPMKPNVVIWGTLLGACRVHNNVHMGIAAAEKLIELDPSDPWARVMLCNLYADVSMWDGVMRLRKEVKDVGTKKTPGCSSIELNGKVYEFLAGDSLHPQHDKIKSLSRMIETQIKASYISNFPHVCSGYITNLL